MMGDQDSPNREFVFGAVMNVSPETSRDRSPKLNGNVSPSRIEGLVNEMEFNMEAPVAESKRIAHQRSSLVVESPPVASVADKDDVESTLGVQQFSSDGVALRLESTLMAADFRDDTAMQLGMIGSASIDDSSSFRGLSKTHEEQRQKIMESYRERAENTRRASHDGGAVCGRPIERFTVEERWQRLQCLKASNQQRLDFALDSLKKPEKGGSFMGQLVSCVLPSLVRAEKVEKKDIPAIVYTPSSLLKTRMKLGEETSDHAIDTGNGNTVACADPNAIVCSSHKLASSNEVKEEKAFDKDIHLIYAPRLLVQRPWPIMKIDYQHGCVRAAFAVPIPNGEAMMTALTRNDTVKAVMVGAASGGILVGATGASCGGIVGTSLGALCGMPGAPFTFGISVLVGAGVCGSTGVCIGTVAGSSVGTVGGGTAGFIGWKLRWLPSVVLDRINACRAEKAETDKADVCDRDDVAIRGKEWRASR